MVSKCANPDCAATYLYFHTGRLFRVETAAAHLKQQLEDEIGTKKPLRHLEFYWLCDACAGGLTLAFEKGVGISVRPKLARSATAA